MNHYPQIRPKDLKIFIKPWSEAEQDAFLVRREVFIQEQGVPAELEIDEFDPTATHVLGYQDGQCIGTGRLVALGNGQAQIGRMAVLVQFRKQGIGTQILESLIELAKSRGMHQLILHAQIAAIPFYERMGFQAEGPTYDEAGIPHRNMILVLPK